MKNKLFILILSMMALSSVCSEKDKAKLPDVMSVAMKPRTGIGSDLGANAGSVAVTVVMGTLDKWGASVWSALSNAGTYVAGVASTVAAAPATPYVAGGVAATWVGHKVYRSYYPTPEQREKNTEHERKSTENEEQAEHHKCKRDRSRLC